MPHNLQFYIDGEWVEPWSRRTLDVINPATERPTTTIAMGSREDIDRAVAAARAAFPAYAATSSEYRIELLQRIAEAYRQRIEDIAVAISNELGAPLAMTRSGQATLGVSHFQQMIAELKTYEFDAVIGTTMITREPIGVCGLITPWNFPMNQVACKVAPALAAGCTIVLKPSEFTPTAAIILAEILHAAGVPKGVFNLINGDGPTVGAAIAAHPDIDMVSFTGSTRAGVLVAKAAADTVKRVTQELGGKSPNIILDDAAFAKAVKQGVETVFRNSGQVCTSPTRMLVPASRQEEAIQIARQVAASTVVGDPAAPATVMGPVANGAQFRKVQEMITAGINEGAQLVAGGPGRPDGISQGYFVRPTVFANVRNDMAIAREEIFGPVLTIIPYQSEDEAIAIANDTPYGLSSVVTAADINRARAMARKIRAGMVLINGAKIDRAAPFGGYKHSGNGREGGRYGLEEFLEVKSMFGYSAER